jgi:hypothetical protein
MSFSLPLEDFLSLALEDFLSLTLEDLSLLPDDLSLLPEDDLLPDDDLSLLLEPLPEDDLSLLLEEDLLPEEDEDWQRRWCCCRHQDPCFSNQQSLASHSMFNFNIQSKLFNLACVFL